jgi:hypothetical protein
MPGGRPTVMTPETLSKLEEAFLLGCTDLEACFAADIGETTLYRYIEANPEFRDRKEALKQNPVWKARGVIMDALEAKDVATANKIIDRKEGSKVAVTGAGGGPVAITIEGFSNVGS